MQRSALATLGLLITGLLCAESAGAAPHLFAGNLEIANVYRSTLICGKQVAVRPNFMPSCPSQPVQTASVTGSGGLTVPPQAFSTEFKSGPGFLTPLSGFPSYYQAFLAYRARSNTGTGFFHPIYAPSLTTTLLPNNTLPPQALGTTRLGLMRIKPGPNRFGGKMRVRDYGFFAATRSAAGPGFYTMLLVMATRYRGSGFAGVNTNVVSGSGSHSFLITSMDSPVMQQTVAGSTHAGFFTGTVTVANMRGALSTGFTTVTGMDTRNTAGTKGRISLASPLLVWTYDSSDGSVLRLRNGFSSYVKLRLHLPEPSRLALLSVGLLGLLSLDRLRRRAI